MIVRLRTRCGCERFEDVDANNAPRQIRVAMIPRINFDNPNPYMLVRYDIRRFILEGLWEEKMPLYIEEYDDVK